MQADFHYYATYCAAYLAGYSHEESMQICYSAQFVDLCSKTFLTTLKAPEEAATTMLQLEMVDARVDIIGLQEITRIWAPFHFLPKDLTVQKKGRPRRYMDKYRLICGPNGELVKDTVMLAKGGSLQAAGIAMHVVADTWAHMNFAGTPSLVINNTTDDFYEIYEKDGKECERKITFRHNPTAPDDPEQGMFTNSVYQSAENSVMNLGHGRAGHLPDYSYIRYRYLPAWDDYKETYKDNPSDYFRAFTQLVAALRFLRGDIDTFETGRYDEEAVKGYEDRIKDILKVRRLIASEDWKKFGEDLSGKVIDDFDIDKYRDEYSCAGEDEKEGTFLGKFINAAIAHKTMVCSKIAETGSRTAGMVRRKEGRS